MDKIYDEKPRTIVISQPMYFPWIGMLQQIQQCDVFVYYDDVQFTRGFFNRVQIKCENGVNWLTVPTSNWKRGQLINEVKIDNTKNWKANHLNKFKRAYCFTPFYKTAVKIIEDVFSNTYNTVSELSQASTDILVDYCAPICGGKDFIKSSSLSVSGSSSCRILNICKILNGKTYLTGHGAQNYLDHVKLEQHGIDVCYADYNLIEYPQLHGQFTPFVSILDLIANCGPKSIEYINGSKIGWRAFLNRG